MNNSFRENFHWVTLSSIAVIYGYYFIRVLPTANADISAEQFALFAGLLVLLIMVHIIGAIILIAVARFKDPDPDERDRQISLLARRNASWILVMGIWAGMAAAFFLPGNFWVMHALLAGLVLAQLAESATEIFLYRRGF